MTLTHAQWLYGDILDLSAERGISYTAETGRTRPADAKQP